MRTAGVRSAGAAVATALLAVIGSAPALGHSAAQAGELAGATAAHRMSPVRQGEKAATSPPPANAESPAVAGTDAKSEKPPPKEEKPTGGSAVAWGENYSGQLGTIYQDNYEVSPVAVEGLGAITELRAAESFNLALLSNGTVASWGGDGEGQLGADQTKANWERGESHFVVKEEDPATHEPSGNLHGVKAIAAADQHALALMDDGTVMAWGNDEYGQLGDGKQGFEKTLNINTRLPKPVPGLTGIVAIAAGGGSDYALTSRGTVLAWGSNTEGQLGLGEPGPDHCETEVARFPDFSYCSERPLPVMWESPRTGQEEELSGVRAVYAGSSAAYALLENGHLVSWGGNHWAELGTGAPTVRSVDVPPAEVIRANGMPLAGVVEVAAGAQFALARLEDGEVLGWGDATEGALAGASAEDCSGAAPPKKRAEGGGAKPCVKEATPISSLESLGVEALSAGRNFGLALSRGSVFAWGSNQRAQLGNGKTPRAGFGERERGYPAPARVKGLGSAAALSAGGTHSLVLLKPAVAPPPPLLTVAPAELALKLTWQPETVNGAEQVIGERLAYRPFERLTEQEPAEEGGAADEEGPPVNLTSEPPVVTARGEALEGQSPVEGQRLNAEPGGWTGARPITFSYQWQRCNARGESCASIAGAGHPGYSPVAADTGSTLRIVVTAVGPEPPASSARSQPTELVVPPAEGEIRRGALTKVKLTGLEREFIISKTLERTRSRKGELTELWRALEPIPYEVKFVAAKKPRVMVLTPLG
ncbi:MAG: RCC1 domain-containing protein [Solirubrobacteraceae bacterium]